MRDRLILLKVRPGLGEIKHRQKRLHVKGGERNSEPLLQARRGALRQGQQGGRRVGEVRRLVGVPLLIQKFHQQDEIIPFPGIGPLPELPHVEGNGVGEPRAVLVQKGMDCLGG